MNYEKVTQEIKSRLGESALHALMTKNQALLEVYPGNVVEHKKKAIQTKIERASDELYQKHAAVAKYAKEYENSLILAGNDVVVPHMISEAISYAKTLLDLEFAKSQLRTVEENKVVNLSTIQPLMAYYKNLVFKPKDVLSGLLTDLALLSERYDFEGNYGLVINNKEIAARFNNELDEYKEILKNA